MMFQRMLPPGWPYAPANHKGGISVKTPRVLSSPDLTEKTDPSLNLIEINIAENDLVYVLTEIDSGRPAGRARGGGG